MGVGQCGIAVQQRATPPQPSSEGGGRRREEGGGRRKQGEPDELILQLQTICNKASFRPRREETGMAITSLSQERPPVSPEPDPSLESDSGWRRTRSTHSLSEVFGTIAVRPTGSLWRKLTAFLGPGYLVAVGYMDPGNWATSLAGGSKFGYALLSIALLSNIMAIILQALCARLG